MDKQRKVWQKLIKNKLHYGFKQVVNYVSQNTLVVSLFLTLTIGVVIGSLVFRDSGETNVSLQSLFTQFVNARSNVPFFRIFCRSLLGFLLPLILCYFLGLFMYGFVPCYLLMLAHGMGYGSVCSYIYSAMGLKGVAFVMLVILPSGFIHMVVLQLAAREAFCFSVILSRSYFLDVTVLAPANRLKRYHVRYLVLAAFIILAALLDGLLSYVFLDVFLA